MSFFLSTQWLSKILLFVFDQRQVIATDVLALWIVERSDIIKNTLLVSLPRNTFFLEVVRA
jgi:hypothetical protein